MGAIAGRAGPSSPYGQRALTTLDGCSAHNHVLERFALGMFAPTLSSPCSSTMRSGSLARAASGAHRQRAGRVMPPALQQAASTAPRRRPSTVQQACVGKTAGAQDAPLQWKLHVPCKLEPCLACFSVRPVDRSASSFETHRLTLKLPAVLPWAAPPASLPARCSALLTPCSPCHRASRPSSGRGKGSLERASSGGPPQAHHQVILRRRAVTVRLSNKQHPAAPRLDRSFRRPGSCARRPSALVSGGIILLDSHEAMRPWALGLLVVLFPSSRLAAKTNSRAVCHF
jgi:hypothetical protein